MGDSRIVKQKPEKAPVPVASQLAQLKGEVRFDVMFHASDPTAVKKVDSQRVSITAYVSVANQTPKIQPCLRQLGLCRCAD